MTKYNEAAKRLKDYLDLKLNIQAVSAAQAFHKAIIHPLFSFPPAISAGSSPARTPPSGRHPQY